MSQRTSQAAPNGRGLCHRHPRGTPKTPVSRRVAEANGCRSSPGYEQDPTPRQPTSSGTAEPGTTRHLPQDAVASRGTLFLSCFSGTSFWQGAGWQREKAPPVLAGKRLWLKSFNLPINYLFSWFIEGEPHRQTPWMLAGLGRGSCPHRSSHRSRLCCCPRHEVTWGPEELNAITRRARIQVSHYIGAKRWSQVTVLGCNGA